MPPWIDYEPRARRSQSTWWTQPRPRDPRRAPSARRGSGHWSGDSEGKGRWNGGAWANDGRGGFGQSQSQQSHYQASQRSGNWRGGGQERQHWRDSLEGKAAKAREVEARREGVLERSRERHASLRAEISALLAALATAADDILAREAAVKEAVLARVLAETAAKEAATDASQEEFQDCNAGSQQYHHAIASLLWRHKGNSTFDAPEIKEAIGRLSALLAAAVPAELPPTAEDAHEDVCDMAVDEESKEALDRALVLANDLPDSTLRKEARQAAIDKYHPAAKRCKVKVPSGG